MRRCALLLLVILVLPSLGFCGVSISLDAAALSVLWEKDFNATATVGVDFSDKLAAYVPVTFMKTDDASCVDLGLFVKYTPFGHGFYAGLGLVEALFFKNNVRFINELHLGYEFDFSFGMTVTPTLVIRDPSGAFSTQFDEIQELLSCYSRFRFRLYVGWKF